ncbi:N-alpha-acetyltransferase 30 [Armadillidium vulgare]|nr:N-alpha-acetyltransferase 30 [Armadillidium vulgare]
MGDGCSHSGIGLPKEVQQINCFPNHCELSFYPALDIESSNLVQRAIREMAADDADEVVLETEITNKPALQLYENLGFVRDKRLFRYYLNGVDALRLKLWLS